MLDKKVVIYGLAVIEAILFGMSFLAAKVALEAMTPVSVLAVRWAVAAALFIVLSLFKVIKLDYRKKPLRLAALAAAVQPCTYAIFEIWGINMTTTAESAIILALVPIFVTVITVVMFKEKIKKKAAVAIVLSFAGVIMTVAFNQDAAASGKWVGYICLLMAVISGAAFMVISSKIADKFTSTEVTFAMAMAGAIFFNAVSFAQGTGVESYIIMFSSWKIWVSVGYLGVMCSFICYMILNVVMAKIPAPQASTLQINLITVTGVLSGVLFRGESLDIYKIMGLTLILVGVVVANKQSGQEALK